ncbi:hypothetical protein M407DRAFT_244418 [Tulasnella calospora MUT 4182]|uniref:Uncharacterized protein n=1 Tax=Tulasnella calospora MUT 4182 TaxID=1051891 RepID=A0A0C3KSP3_9AGAM|nr:hypothetical protein M407DRAFT_244418 [Tulasnella calospora MUT 4182]
MYTLFFRFGYPERSKKLKLGHKKYGTPPTAEPDEQLQSDGTDCSPWHRTQMLVLESWFI